MNNTNENNIVDNFTIIYNMQLVNQLKMLQKGMYDGFLGGNRLDSLPVDNINLSSYHIQQLMSEIGEVLEADKRWKNFRNGKYDKDDKLEEISDCFIVLLNIAIFSGYTSPELISSIKSKLKKVLERVEEN